MRLLLIEEDTHRCAHIRQRLTAWRAQAQLVVHSPLSQGALVADFLAQGFDAVLLADQWPGGRGLHWARELAARAGFAPIVLLCEGRDDSLARELSALGAFSVSHEDLDREAFTQVLTAAERRQSHARAIWRSSQAGRETQRFGDAFIRGYRCIRRLAAGVTSDLYVGESERAGALVALKVARDRQDEDQPVDAFRRFLQEYEIAQRIDCPAVVRFYDLGVSDEHAWLVMEYFAQGDLRRRMRAGLAPREALRLGGAVRRGAAARSRDRRGARGGARRRGAAPRPQARQHHAARRRQHRADRLRAVEGCGAGARHNRHRHHLRHAALHEPRAGPRGRAR